MALRGVIIVAILLPMIGCMSAADKSRQDEQMRQLVQSLTPEQKAILSRKILEHMTGLDNPGPTQCYTYQNGYTSCW